MKKRAACDSVGGQNDDVSSAAVPVNPAEDTRVINVARQKSTKPVVALTEEQFVHMLQDLWSVGYALVPGMPIEEQVVRRCFDSLQKTFCELEFPGDLLEMMQRVADRDDEIGR